MAFGIALLFNVTIYLFYFPYSYHKLLVTKYGCKREKSLEAKWRSAEEQRPMHEMERAVDVDFFLEAQAPWAKDSPHCLIIFHEMFLHAASEGQKEAEWDVCWGCWQYMPQLDPEAGIPAIQLVPSGDWQRRTPRPLLGGLQATQATQFPTRRTGNFEGGIISPPLPFTRGGKALLTSKGSLLLKISTHPGANRLNGREKAC